MRLDLRLFTLGFVFTVGPLTALAQVKYDEVVIFDSSESYDEGLARQRLGLLDATGKPKVDAGGNLLPLVSADGKKKAYDQKGGAKVIDALKELKANGGSVIVIAHGNVGIVAIDKKVVPGFDGGTGVQGGKENPITLAGIGALTNVDLKMVVCKAGAVPAGAAPPGVQKRSVAQSFEKEIQNQGGTVAATAASAEVCFTSARIQYQLAASPADFDVFLAAQKATSDALSKLDLTAVALRDHHATVQAILDAKWPAVSSPTISKIEYVGKIPGSPEVKTTTTDLVVALDFPNMRGGYHHGCAGAGGFVPELAYEGFAVGGNLISIELSNGPGGSIGIVLIGLQKAHVPASGGCALLLGSIVSQLAVPLTAGGPGSGKFTLPAMLPPIPAPISIYLQGIVADPTVPFGYTMTNGLRLDLEPAP